MPTATRGSIPRAALLLSASSPSATSSCRTFSVSCRASEIVFCGSRLAVRCCGPTRKQAVVERQCAAREDAAEDEPAFGDREDNGVDDGEREQFHRRESEHDWTPILDPSTDAVSGGNGPKEHVVAQMPDVHGQLHEHHRS